MLFFWGFFSLYQPKLGEEILKYDSYFFFIIHNCGVLFGQDD